MSPTYNSYVSNAPVQTAAPARPLEDFPRKSNEPVPPSQITSQFAELAGVISQLEIVASVLLERINPVLRDCEGSQTALAKEQGPLCPIADVIRTQANRINAVVYSLNHTTSRVEL